MKTPVAMPHQKPRKLFPGWRLKNGLMKASEKELEESGSSCERWALWGAGLVILGVVAEVAIAAIHPPYDSFSEQWGSTLANALVAVGIAAEVLFARMGSRRQHEVSDRLRKKLAPRALNTEAFLEAMKGIPAPTLPVRVLFLKDDRESMQLAEQIWGVLNKELKWVAQFIWMTEPSSVPSAIYAGAPSTSGVAVLEHQPPEHQGVFTGTWGPALVKGLAASLEEVSLGYEIHPQPMVRIVVAQKPLLD